MERTGAHLHVVRLQDHAALLAPELLKRQDQILERLTRLDCRQADACPLTSGPCGILLHGSVRVGLLTGFAHWVCSLGRTIRNRLGRSRGLSAARLEACGRRAL